MSKKPPKRPKKAKKSAKPSRRTAKRAKATSKAKAEYGARRFHQAARQASMSAAGRDIGTIPPVVDGARRDGGLSNFRVFCETYFPARFFLTWSADHLRVIAKIERVVTLGNLCAIAMPRGAGKSSMSTAATIWAALRGQTDPRRSGIPAFVVIVAATATKGKQILADIKTTFETNEHLGEDFPAVCVPIRKLERIANRCKGQTHNGASTYVEWGAEKIVLPTIPGSSASGAVIAAVGLDSGNLRGLSHTLPDGQQIRPSLVFIDDPQTRESALSPSQTEQRLAILNGDVLGLAGPGQKISGIAACTVIASNDLSDQLLDRKRNPDWQGERAKMLYAMPENMELWEEYGKIRRDELEADGDGSEATAFYQAHREAMDAGAVPAWPERFNPDEVSALQHAMNLKLRNEAAFLAEYQNQPAVATVATSMMSAAEIAAKTNGLGRGQVPKAAQHLSAFVDCHDDVLFWGVAAWEPDFTGCLLDYGTHPDQGRAYFLLADARITLRRNPTEPKEAALCAGVESIVRDLLSRRYQREDGATIQVGRLLVDSGYLPDVIATALRRVGQASVAMPSKGIGIGAASKPFSEYRHEPGRAARNLLAYSAGVRRRRAADGAHRHEQLEVIPVRKARHRSRSEGLLIPVRRRASRSPHARRSLDFGISDPDQRPWSGAGRVATSGRSDG